NYPPAKDLREPWRIFTGLARLRRDGFAYLTVAPMQRAQTSQRFNVVGDYDVNLEATVKTIPIIADTIDGRTLHANVGSLAPRFAWIRTQIRDAATGRVIEGYSFDECEPLEEDSLDHTFQWNGSASLAAARAERIQIEFKLFGVLDSPRLYSFWFE